MSSEVIAHYGTPRHSGRYPWGSGENPYQHNANFLRQVKQMRSDGVSEGDIAKAFGYKSSSELKARVQQATNNNKASDHAYALKLKQKGWSNVAIGRKMGINESSVRSLLEKDRSFGADETDKIMRALRDGVKKTGYLDVGRGSNLYLNTTEDRFKKATLLMKDEGYEIKVVRVNQLTQPGQQTEFKILCKKDTPTSEIYKNLDQITTLADLTPQEGAEKINKLGMQKPQSISSDRVFIRYGPEGGESKDGVIELRRGVADLSLGEDHYAQVRIAVDDTHYMKGMAMYSDNIPDGYDVVYNTNKGTNKTKQEVFKELEKDAITGEIDWDNPFKAQLKSEGGQYTYLDKDGNEHLSAINKIRSEGEWAEWSNNRTLASQMLAKQPVALAKQQLKITQEMQKSEYDEIMSITNPTVRRKMLLEFADECDKMSVNLKAASMPRQATKVILPVPSLKDNEIYAPTFKDGETVVLIRYPHAGTFEIPELKVNNRNKEGKEVLGGLTQDAVGINMTVAAQLSGADFDGDNVLVIPNNSGAIRHKSPLADLKDFDTKKAYGTEDYTPEQMKGTKLMTKNGYNNAMGQISNLITDMTIAGAKDEELARAVKHSMVVIDAYKHKLDYQKSAVDNGIAELKKKYQPPREDGHGGASTLLSRNKSPVTIDKRQGAYKIDPTTGEKIWNVSNHSFTNEKGETKRYTQTVDLLSVTKDAHDISSGTLIEEVYANHSNAMKALANKARLSSLGLKTEYNAEAAKTYASEVESLKAKLNKALMNAPRERQAQLLGTVVSREKINAGNIDDKKMKSRIRNQSAAAARIKVGATKEHIIPTQSEWNAIQAGAIHDTTLNKILANCKTEEIRKFALPKENSGMTSSKIAMAKSMANRGYTLEEIATHLGFSTSTISKAIKS